MVFLLAEKKLAERAALKTINGQTSGESGRVGEVPGRPRKRGSGRLAWRGRKARTASRSPGAGVRRSRGHAEATQRPRTGDSARPELRLGSSSLSSFSLQVTTYSPLPQQSPGKWAPVGKDLQREDPAF